MAYIKVDHSKFESAASAIDSYVKQMNSKMSEMQSGVTAMSSAWQGADYTQFATEFQQLDDGDSAHKQMVKAMESYAKYLRYAGKKYKDAQARAVDRAGRLPRW